ACFRLETSARGPFSSVCVRRHDAGVSCGGPLRRADGIPRMNIESYFHQAVEFVRAHEAWAAPIVFALAFGESLAFISLLIPAWGALVAIGALIGPSGISFWPVWIAGAVGAALGDWLSYWIGVKLEYRVAH